VIAVPESLGCRFDRIGADAAKFRTFDGTSHVVVDVLRDRIAPDFRTEFRRRTDVPVTVAPLDGMKDFIVSATVVRGVLRVEAHQSDPDDPVPTGRVAWIIDTGADGG